MPDTGPWPLGYEGQSSALPVKGSISCVEHLARHVILNTMSRGRKGRGVDFFFGFTLHSNVLFAHDGRSTGERDGDEKKGKRKQKWGALCTCYLRATRYPRTTFGLFRLFVFLSGGGVVIVDDAGQCRARLCWRERAVVTRAYRTFGE